MSAPVEKASRAGRDAEALEVQGQDRRERAADEVHEEQDDQQRRHVGQAEHRGQRRARPRRPPRPAAGRGRLVVEGQQQAEGDRARRRRHQERPADADRGRPGTRPASGPTAADRICADWIEPTARPVCSRGARDVAIARPRGPIPPNRPMPGPQHEELADAGDERGEDHQHDVGQQRADGHPLLAVAVGEAPPDRRQQAREQRRHADEDARPLRDLLLAVRRPARARRGEGRAARTRSR